MTNLKEQIKNAELIKLLQIVILVHSLDEIVFNADSGYVIVYIALMIIAIISIIVTSKVA